MTSISNLKPARAARSARAKPYSIYSTEVEQNFQDQVNRITLQTSEFVSPWGTSSIDN